MVAVNFYCLGLCGFAYYYVEFWLKNYFYIFITLRKAAEPVIVIDEMSKRVFKQINKLDHPNLIKVDYFYDDGFFYVIRTYDDDYVRK